MNKDDFLSRTRKAFGDELLQIIKDTRFCVVGCGGTGALFAEMLVRSGAQNLVLIDGDSVDVSNLNRVVSFSRADIGNKKVDALKSRFLEINSKLSITAIPVHLREYDKIDCKGQQARDAVHDTNVAILAVDNNRDRIECEKLCFTNGQIKTLGIGVEVQPEGDAGYEVAWCGKTPEISIDNEGYGVGSYVSIVVEATAVAFAMMLHNLQKAGSSDYKYYSKKYCNFTPN